MEISNSEQNVPDEHWRTNWHPFRRNADILQGYICAHYFDYHGNLTAEFNSGQVSSHSYSQLYIVTKWEDPIPTCLIFSQSTTD